MQNISLYRYELNGKVTITPHAKTESDVPSRLRLVADEDYVLTNGIITTPAVDIILEDTELWNEVADTGEATEINLKSQAYDILMGVTE